MVDKASEADLFTDVRLDEIADAVLHGGGEAASASVGRLGHGHEAEHAEARLRVDTASGQFAREIGFGQWRSEQGAPVVAAGCVREQDGNVLAAAAFGRGTDCNRRVWKVARLRRESFRRERTSGAQTRSAPMTRWSSSTAREHGGRSVVGGQGGDDPFVAKVLAEEALFRRHARKR